MLSLFLKSIIAPTKLNHRKAWVLKTWFLIPVTSFLFLAHSLSLYSGWRSYQVQGSFSDLTPEEIVRLTNQKRDEAQVPLLAPNPLLNEAAAQKAQNMVETGVFDHYYESEDQTISPWQFVEEQGYNYFYAGENLGKDFYLSQDLVQAWMDSPTHRDNLLNPVYTEIGVAVIIGPYLDQQETSLIVQLFATPMEVALAANPDLSPGDSGAVNVAPILEHNRSWSQTLIKEYSNIIWYATAVVVILVGTGLVIETRQLKKPSKSEEISIDLWRH